MSIFLLAALIGLALPLLLLPFIWNLSEIRKATLLFLAFQFFQIISERLLAYFSLRYVIKYTAFAFVSVRIYQLFYASRFRSRFRELRSAVRWLLGTAYLANMILWTVVWLRLFNRIFL